MWVKSGSIRRALRISLVPVGMIPCLIMVCGWGCGHVADTSLHLPEEIDFNFHIRPILSDNCFLCHGPDESSREADLRLDLEETATMRRNGITAIVPGYPAKSELIKRITSQDPDYAMPPPSTNKKLSERQRALLTQWIKEGAEWKPYWAFQAPDHPITEKPAQHPVDHFIEKKLTQNELTRAPSADASTLIRRLSFLLTGLPPTPAMLSQYSEIDKDQKKYLQLVDTLLASSHYGERWARHWMDLVRYAEGKGHEFDYPVLGAWKYRDYLIRAFNQDLPYDRFVKEQLAGDLLPNPRRHPIKQFNESIIGTAFYTLGETKHSPVDSKEEEAIRIDNIIDVTTKTFQALTLACSRCHDHKFDPLPTADYYALYGIFESTRYDRVSTDLTIQKLELIDSIDLLKSDLQAFLDRKLQDQPPTGVPVNVFSDHPGMKIHNLEIVGDFSGPDFGNWFSDGLAFGKSTTATMPKLDHNNRLLYYPLQGRASSRVYGQKVMGALRSPTFVLEKPFVGVRVAGHLSTVRIILDNHQLIQDPIHGGLTRELNDPEMKNYFFNLEMWIGSKIYIEVLPGKFFRKNGKGHHFRIDPDAWVEMEYAWTVDTTVGPEPLPVKTSRRQIPLIETEFSNIAQSLHKIEKLKTKIVDTSFCEGVTDGDAIFSPVFIRGSHKQPSEEKMPHRYLTVLDGSDQPFDTAGSGRLKLAEKIASAENPLTSRVMVNRIWHHLFGRGIVETVDNFGLQGKIPSHPDLLDHLAVEFMENEWSVKKLIRYIVTSQTFRQSTEKIDVNQQIDPDNIYLHHFSVRRLEAEAIRDAILAVSGTLDPMMFGPPIPIYLTEFLKGRGRPPASGPIDGNGRRSIYQALWRNFLPPMMLTFDMPIPFSTFGKRNVTNVPAQSLTLLNDPFVQQEAGRWARKLLNRNKSYEDMLRDVFNSAFARMPQSKEMSQAIEFLEKQKSFYPDLDPEELELMIWTDYCHSMFNTKEFIYLL